MRIRMGIATAACGVMIAGVALLPAVADAHRTPTRNEKTQITKELRHEFHPGARYKITGIRISTVPTHRVKYAVVGEQPTNGADGGIILMKRSTRGWRILSWGSSPNACVFPSRVRRDLLPGWQC